MLNQTISTLGSVLSAAQTGSGSPGFHMEVLDISSYLILVTEDVVAGLMTAINLTD